MPNKEAVIAKFKETFSSYKIAYDRHQKSKKEKADPLTEHRLDLESKVLTAKVKLFFQRLKEAVPKEKRAEANLLLEEVYKKSLLSQVSFETNLKTIQLLTPKEQMPEYLFHRDVPAKIFERGLGEDFFNVLMDYADVSQLDALEEEIDAYQSPQLTNFKVYPLKEQVEALKKKNAESMQDIEALNALNEELDRISDLVVTSTVQYSVANGDDVEKIYSGMIAKEVNECNQRNVRSDKYKHLGEYLDFAPKNTLDDLKGTCEITAKHKEDIHLHEVFSREDVKLQIAEDKKEALRNIVKFMKSCGLLDRDQSMGESGEKIYSFNQIRAADERLKELLKSGSQDLNAYRAAREEYERALENMRQIYKMIEEQIKPTNEMMVGNVSSFREDWIPNEFKDSLLINSYANSIYNLALVIYNGELDLDEFLENPNKGCIDAMGKLSETLSPGTVMGRRSMGTAIRMALKSDEPMGYPALTISRSAELLLQLSGGTDAYEHNAMASLLISSYEFRVQQGIQQNERVGFAGYSHKSPFQTVANILLVNDADRDYNKLRTFEALTGDFKATIPPFHTMEYLERNAVDPDAFLKRITDVIDELSVKNEDEVHLTDAPTRACVLRGAQLAAHQ